MKRNFIAVFENAVREQEMLLDKLYEARMLNADFDKAEIFNNVVSIQEGVVADCKKAMMDLRQAWQLYHACYIHKPNS